MGKLALSFLLLGLMSSATLAYEAESKKALQEFNHLIGSWRGTGQPEGTLSEKQKGFWLEKIEWQWQFAKENVWLKLDIAKGKYYDKGELHYLPKSKTYRLTLHTPKKEKVIFEGKKEGRRLYLDCTDPARKEDQRLVFTFLHSNRYLYRFETKSKEGSRYKKIYQVGVTKQGVPFAGKGSNEPECIVSGGKGTMEVTYKGKTYYVCCSGCRGV